MNAAISCIAMSIVIGMTGCKSEPQTVLSGTIRLETEWKPMVYLIQPIHFSEILADFQGKVIDSSAIDKDGHFAFHTAPAVTDNTLFLLAIQRKDSNLPNHLTDEIPSGANYMPFCLSPGESLTCTAESKAFQETFTVAPVSAENKAVIVLRDLRIAAFKKYLTAHDQLAENDTLLLEKEKAHLLYAMSIMDFADTTQVLEAAMLAIRWASPSGDYERIPEFITRQCDKWQKAQPNHSFVRELCSAARKETLPILVGDHIPDFPLPLLHGDTVNSMGLLGQKLTLLDIWASWCAPCRKENRAVLAPLYSEFMDQGFRIIGYSIDGDENAWKTAVDKDGAAWLQASHLTGDATPFMDALRITTIPANFILDAEGKVLAKNLHGEELREFVEGYLE